MCQWGLCAGDFVIVNFAGKTKSYNYVGLVEKVDGADISAKFLKRSSKRSVDGKPIFTFKENDEGVIPREDVHKKLPTPQKLGGTARSREKCIFRQVDKLHRQVGCYVVGQICEENCSQFGLHLNLILF